MNALLNRTEWKSDKGKRVYRRHTAFTMVEILVVMAIALVLIALLTSVSSRVLSGNQKTKCVANLRQIGIASARFSGDHQGILPNFYYSTTPNGTPQAPAAAVGQWFWHLAPYVEVPRWENGGMNLGEPGKPIMKPVVFTCPANALEEANGAYLTYPSWRPVSYAPPSYAQGENSMNLAELMALPGTAGAYFVYPPVIQQIVRPSKKIWISDSPVASVLNVTVSRWNENYSPPSSAWPRVAFSRHEGGGNALFYDGHIEWLALETFTQPPEGVSMVIQLRRYFDPYYEN